MEKIAIKLIHFGMDFQYENYGSKGEKIISFTLGIEISIQDGKIYFNDTVFEENEGNLFKVLALVETACIEETN